MLQSAGKNRNYTTPDQQHQGTAVGYRAFSNGAESVSLGNDTVAWGDLVLLLEQIVLLVNIQSL